MADRYLRFTNWERYQHYQKKRTKSECPPSWIKLHTRLLESEGYAELPENTQAHLIKLLLLAARTGNKIKADATHIRHMIHAKSPVKLDLIIGSGMCEYIPDDSSVLAPCKQDASPRREEERREDSDDAPVLADSQQDPPTPYVEDPPDLVVQLVNTWPSVFKTGMLNIGVTRRNEIEAFIAMSGGVKQAGELLTDAITRQVRAPLAYAMKVATEKQAEADLAKNRPERKYLSPKDVLNEH